MAYRFDRVEGPAPGDGWVEVGWFQTSREAKDRMLVLLSLGLESWIEPVGPMFSLRVAETDEDAALRALAADSREESGLVVPPPALSLPKAWDVFWAGVAAMVLAGFHLLASSNPELWQESGLADSERIVAGSEWYRAGTALCLHSDLSHLAANLLFGALFLWFLSPRLGAGVAWLMVFGAGFAGNMVNAFVHAGAAHQSLGASTSVFGALGMLVGLEMASAVRGGGWGPMRRVLVPFGAGLALLAWLGTEGDHTDVLAHLWGFAVGMGLGSIYGALAAGLPRPGFRVAAGAAVVVALAVCWMLALQGVRGR